MCQKFRDALAAWNTERYVSMRQCAEAFGVPRTSLNDMIREGRTEWRGKGGEGQGVHCRGGAHHDEVHRGSVGAGYWTDIATNIFSKHLKCSFSYQ